MKTTNYTNDNYKLKQLKLPLEIEKIIEISNSVYSFCEIVDCIDLNSYFAKKVRKNYATLKKYGLELIDFKGLNVHYYGGVIQLDN